MQLFVFALIYRKLMTIVFTYKDIIMQRISPLLTDQYQFTMAYGYWQCNKAEQQAVFRLSFRTLPFKNNYAITCGLTDVINFLKNFELNKDELAYLASLKDSNGSLMFSKQFINYLEKLHFTCTIKAIPEGTLVFANEPLLEIEGPLLQCQLLETPLLNLLGFSTLVATKAARICRAAQGDPVVEFGLRRAQGPNGGLTASRAAYIGGCSATSNVLAGKIFDIPIKGTMAHSWVMSFSNELEAFRSWAKVMGNETILLLLDTYGTTQGIKNATFIGKELRERNLKLAGVRLDSGDMLKISKQVRKLLDAAGFHDTKILASGDLDEYLIGKLKDQKAPIDIWGVGTRLATCNDQPSLNVVYKLTAINEAGSWKYKRKISDQPEKATTPGILEVRRFYLNKQMVHDVIYDTQLGISKLPNQESMVFKDLLVPIFHNGTLVYQEPTIHETREFALQETMNFLKNNFKKYPVKLDKKLARLQNELQ